MSLLATWRATLRAAAISFSLALLTAPAMAGHFADLAAEMKASTTDDALALVKNDEEAVRFFEIESLTKRLPPTGAERERVRQRLQTLVELCALTEKDSPRVDASAIAKSTKSAVVYRDVGEQEGRNWLGESLSRLRNIRIDWRPKLPNGPNVPQMPYWVTYLLWGLLGAAVLFFVFLAFRHFDWKRRLARRAKALVEDHEPERSLDEWLTAADGFAAEGKHREAVRALYLACLLRFDEARVARFDRRETNWEHLARIEKSPRKPADLDFRTPTRAFDEIWYGFRTQGLPDVERFRVWYSEVTQMVKETPK